MYCDKYPTWPPQYQGVAPWPYNFKFRRDLPSAIKAHVCQCNSDELMLFATYHKDRIRFEDGVKYCLRCELITTDFLDQCSSCGDRFIRDFSHPGYCNSRRYCLDCFLDVPEDDCCTKHNIPTRPIKLETKFDNFPYPKPLTMSEIDDLLEEFA